MNIVAQMLDQEYFRPEYGNFVTYQGFKFYPGRTERVFIFAQTFTVFGAYGSDPALRATWWLFEETEDGVAERLTQNKFSTDYSSLKTTEGLDRHMLTTAEVEYLYRHTLQHQLSHSQIAEICQTSSTGGR